MRDTLNKLNPAIIPMHKKNSRPTVLCFAGLDPSGGAGLQADIETIACCGAHALPIATCLTAQNTNGAFSVDAINPNIIKKQFEVLIEDIQISSCKIGVIPNSEIAQCIAMLIQQLPNVPITYDPVISASYGSQFTDTNTLEVIKSSLLPNITVLTPNMSEANILLNKTVCSISEAYELCDFGPKYILATNADSNTDMVNNALLSTQHQLESYSYPRLSHQYHGSGCTLSSALASYLAHDYSMQEAALMAQDFTYRSLVNAHSIGKGQWIPDRTQNGLN